MNQENLYILDHPLIQQAIWHLRDINTEPEKFRNLLRRVAALMVYEVTRNLPMTERDVVTPMEKTKGFVLANKVTLVPILRAGLGMCDGILALIPQARVGHLGLYRDEDTLRPVEYYCKLPEDIADSEVIVIDPMLATGGSAVTALKFIKNRGAGNIRFVCLVAAPEGVSKMREEHPDVPVYTAALDRELNNQGYILPGLGDAGDRIYGTL